MSHGNVKHGHCLDYKPSRTYISWQMMIQRCDNSKATSYEYYGERGISVCPDWHQFINFLNDMGIKPEGMSLDRINNEGDYEPSNCHWTSWSEQMKNKRQWGVEPINSARYEFFKKHDPYYLD